MKPFARRLDHILPSASMNMAQMIHEGNPAGKVIDLTWGQPDFDTPEHIKKAAWTAIRSGLNGYTPSAGIPELRAAIVDFYKFRYRVSYNSQSEVLVTPGAKQGLMYTMQTLIDSGDEVILFEPYWLSYKDMILLSGGIPRFISAKKRLIPDLSRLEGTITSRTKAILINNPINPSGYVFKRNELEQIAYIADRHNLYIIADEIYDRIVFTEFVSLSEFEKMRERLVIVNGFSKAYAMTGWRVGYLLSCERIISKIKLIHQHTATCAAAPSQYAALGALQGSQRSVAHMCRAYQRRRDFIVKELKGTPFNLVPPKGTFYTMLDLSCLGTHTGGNAERLLSVYGIASVDGAYYGQSAAHYVRLSLTKDIDQLEEAVERLKTINNRNSFY